MSTIGNPTLRAHSAIQDRISQIKTRLDTVRGEAVTGRVGDVGRAVDGQIGKVARMNEAHAYAENRSRVLAFEGERAAIGQQSLGSIRAQAADVRDAVLFALSDGAPKSMTVSEEKAQNAIEDTLGKLSMEYGGRPLFGGDSMEAPFGTAEEMMTALRGLYTGAPDTAAALAAIDTWFNDPAGGFSTTFFRGGDGEAPTVELSKGEHVASNVKGDTDELRSVLQALAITALAKEAPTPEARVQTLEAGRAKLTPAIDGVIVLQSRLGVREERIASAQASFSAEKTSLGIAINAVTGRDQAEAATEMRLLETQLEAAYMTTARMANLTLTNYLR